MAQPLVDCNAIEAFFDAFAGQHLFRAIDHASEEATSFYGELWQFLPDLQRLNAEGRSIYFCVNDPGSLLARTAAFTDLRCIWQDAEPGKTKDPAHEPEIAGQKAHFTVETSPGRFQRFWLCDPVPADMWPIIHRRMVEWHGHDHECDTGPAQIMRAPGFRNIKFKPDGSLFHPTKPVAVIVHNRSQLPRLTLAVVATHFAFPDPLAAVDPNMTNAAQSIQSSGRADNVVPFDRTKPRRAETVDTRNADAQQRAQLHGVPRSSIRLEDILETLALLNPSMGRNEWRKVGGALHFMFEGSDIGLNIFETWSAEGANYKGGFDCVALWNGLDLEHPHPSHWLTLKQMARQVKPGAAERERLRSPAFERLRKELEPSHDYRQLVIHFSERKRTSEGYSQVPEPNSKQNTEDLLHGLGTVARWDLFTSCVVLNDKRMDHAALVDLHSAAFDHGWKPSRAALAEFIEGIARQASFNSAQVYFNGLSGKWDGVHRLSTLFQRHMGAPDSPSIRELGQLIPYAVVRRAFNPGFKFDLMPILQGPQGFGKSSIFQLLCPNEEWFVNSVRLDLEEKRLYTQIQGKLFAEFGELSGKKNAEIEKIKAFVTQQTDAYVKNHEKVPTEDKRVCIFVGTTNEHRVLRDLTGNRRFPIIPVTKELDWDAFRAERDQLWAKTVSWEELTTDLRLSPEAVADMENIQQVRIDRDVTVEEHFDELNAFEEGFVHRNAIWDALGFGNGRDRDKKLTATARYSLNDLEKMLRHAGWSVSEVTKHDGGQGRGHFRKKGRHLVKEIVYSSNAFMYKAELDEEGKRLLDDDKAKM
jgi:hypothetical protein